MIIGVLGGRVRGVPGGVMLVPAGSVRVVGRLLVVALFMVFGRLLVVPGRPRVMFRRLLVVIGHLLVRSYGFLRHDSLR